MLLRAGLIVVWASLFVPAQQALGNPEIEVASVKPVVGPPGAHTVFLRMSHGTARIEAATLRQIIAQAYLVQRVNVVGGPSWYDSDQFDVVAKAASSEAPPEQMRQMLQTVLADRFKLSVHRETRDLNRYILVVGKNGPTFQDSRTDESTSLQQPQAGQLVFQRYGMANLVNTIANFINAPVDDQTGITGLFDYRLDFTAEPGQAPVDRVEIALQAVGRLGLKLEARKLLTDVLVVDRAEKLLP